MEMRDLIDQLAEALAKRVHAHPVPLDVALWNAAEVGAYLGLSPRTVAEKVSVQPGFPRAIIPGIGKQKPERRWKAVEVIAWAESRREAA